MEQLRELVITRIDWETADTATLTLRPVDGSPLLYEPGQYLSVVRHVLGTQKRRAYSFSSHPAVDPLPQITIKRVPNGEFSNWLLQRQVGEELTTTNAYGKFTLPAKLPSQLLYIAGGSGITPILSHLKGLLAQKNGPRILLLYANSSAENTIFKTTIDQWAEQFSDRFECIYIFSKTPHVEHGVFGHLNNGLLEQLLEARHWIKALPRTLCYLCAPFALMRKAEMMLHVLDCPAEHIHKETFRPDQRMTYRSIDKTRVHQVQAQFGPESFHFEAYAGETILNAALRQGIALPYSCKSGICLSCLARCTAGEVDIDFVDLQRREGPGALINTCIGYPVSKSVSLHYE
ncbi:MAG: iron-sulfur cluster-binding domain-containing protein [Lewinellaceae bacterium]|nr:iron-sulfur cluster-binding domain-containing protein [Lewinellaceae bacterium]